MQNKHCSNASVIWKEIIHAFGVIKLGLVWKVRNGQHVRIGEDPWVGCNENYQLPLGLVFFLHERGNHSLEKIVDHEQSTIWSQGWKSLHQP